MYIPRIVILSLFGGINPWPQHFHFLWKCLFLICPTVDLGICKCQSIGYLLWGSRKLLTQHKVETCRHEKQVFALPEMLPQILHCRTIRLKWDALCLQESWRNQVFQGYKLFNKERVSFCVLGFIMPYADICFHCWWKPSRKNISCYGGIEIALYCCGFTAEFCLKSFCPSVCLFKCCVHKGDLIPLLLLNQKLIWH